MTPLPWAAADLELALQAVLPGLAVEVLPIAPSTNTLLLDRARQRADPQPCLLVAEAQTAGRGRQGRPWHSQAAASLTFSLALPLAPGDWSGLSLAVGLALADALDGGPPAPPRIGLKWPNDLWLLDRPAGGRKIGGILIETVSVGTQRLAVVGVGLNVAPLAVPLAGLSQGLASLQEIDARWTPPTVLAQVAAPLLRALLRFERQGFAPLTQAYARRDVLRGTELVTTLPQVSRGLAGGVDAAGALLVHHQGRLHRVVSGEVSVRTAGDALAGAASAGGPGCCA
jgi:BirA family biotin operon repressor/biotin-[acetyl-CoA-carboxylase] ligase